MSARKPKRRFVTTQVEVEGRVETKIVEMPDHAASTWGPDASLRIVGQPVARVDALDKVTGRAVYTADIHRPGMLFAALVRAPVSAGRRRKWGLGLPRRIVPCGKAGAEGCGKRSYRG